MSDILFAAVARTYKIIHLGMNKKTITSQRIGTFDQFCKAQKKKQLLKENNEVAIDVPFYQDAIESVLGDLRYVGGGEPIDWNTLIDYIKVKYLIIDREVPGSGEDLIIAHVRDLLFQKYGDTILGGDCGCLTGDTAAIGAKTLVISQLASDILHKVRVEAGLEPEPEPETDPKPLSKVSLDYDCGYYDDDCYYGERKVAGFGDFSNLLKEDVDRLTLKHDEKALEFCLDKLGKEAGSLKYDDILKVVEKEGTTLVDYLTGIADEYLKTASIELNGQKLKKDNGDEKIVLKQAKKLFAHQIAKEILDDIKKETL